MAFTHVTTGIEIGLEKWEPTLAHLSEEAVATRKNDQGRTIKQILGHMIDSASNNTHRIIHLQYQDSPFLFPNYATNGNNDRWIAIQNYQEENMKHLIQHWKFIHLHLIHVINSVDHTKLSNEWIAGSGYGTVSLKEMINDFIRHFELHLEEIQELIDN